MTNVSSTAGTLYIVATPIGNRDDISRRALTTLQQVDAILAEDTRHSMPFLAALGIKKPLIALHAHNEAVKSDEVLRGIEAGRSYALISDAGTPLISDPGFPLVQMARDKGFDVVAIPGPCALIAALSIAGIPCDTFTFGGFLPAKQAARQAKLKSFHMTPHTLVFYESTHRICESIEDIAKVFGEDSEMVLAKELTKTYETVLKGTPEFLLNWLNKEEAHKKGEFVLILAPREVMTTDVEKTTKILGLLLEELSVKQSVRIAAQFSDMSKNALYQLALGLSKP